MNELVNKQLDVGEGVKMCGEMWGVSRDLGKKQMI